MPDLSHRELSEVHPALRPLVCAAWLLGDDVPRSVMHLAPEDVLAARIALGLHEDDPDPASGEWHACASRAHARFS